jgi:hypothetical protein
MEDAMNADHESTDDARDVLATLTGAAPPDRLDVDHVVRRGQYRRRVRRAGAVAASAAAVVVLLTGLSLAIPGHPDNVIPRHHGNTATPSTRSGEPLIAAVTSLRQLSGRWIAVTIDGRDVSAWRDASGLPANLIVGADGRPATWQANLLCGPLARGTFALGHDAALHASPPAPWMQHCPRSQTAPPDVLGVLARTVSGGVSPGLATRPTRLLLFNAHGQVIADWRADPALASLPQLCSHALLAPVASAGPFTTVADVRALVSGSTPAAAPNVLPTSPDGAVAVYCWTLHGSTGRSYAVTTDGHSVQLSTVNGVTTTPSGAPTMR